MSKFLRKYFFYIFFTGISLSLTFIWFHGGYIIALGESVIPFYSLQNVFKVYGHVWTPISLGFYQTPVGSIPFFAYGLFFEHLGLPGFAVQAIVFCTLVFLMLIGSFIFFQFLNKDRYKKNKTLSFLFGSLFYTFNLIALVSAWNRMQYPFILFYVSLPFILLIFMNAIEKKKLIYAIYLGFLLVPFSMAFTAIPFMELLWTITTLYVLFDIVVAKNKKIIFFDISFLALCVSVWFIFNAWWLLQFFQYNLAIAHAVYTTSGNTQTLTILSAVQGNLSYVLRLMNRDFFIQMEKVWGSWYFTPIFVLISYVIPFLAFFPLLLRKKPSYIYFFLGLSLLFIYCTKGSAGPFGFVFLTLFGSIKFLEPFRGAFEKFGLVLPVAYTPLLVFAFATIAIWLKKRYGTLKTNIAVGSVSFLLFGVLTFPYWNGWIFTYDVPHANNLQTGDYVKVPNYYKQADDYLNKDSADFRTVVLPIENDSVTYNWNGHGFTGLDYTNGLFSKSFVTLSFSVENLDLVISQFQDVLFHAPKFFTTAMNVVNAKYLMIRKDIDYKYRTTMNPDKVQQYIQNTSIPNLFFDKKFGQLLFYKNTSKLSKIYAASTLYGSEQNGLWRDVFNLTNFQQNDVILDTGIGKAQDAFIHQKTSQEFSYPDITINYEDYPVFSYENALHEIPQYYRILPGSPFYKLLLLKETIGLSFIKDQEVELFNLLDLTTKRIGELHQLSIRRDNANAVKAIVYYDESLQNFRKFDQVYDFLVQNNIQYAQYKASVEEAILDHLINTVEDKNLQIKLIASKSLLQKIGSQIGIFPQFANQFSTKGKAIVYRYNLASSGIYNVLLRYEDMPTWYSYNTEGLPLQINNTLFTVKPTIHDGFLDFGQFSLKKGINEVQVGLPTPKNLAEETEGKIATTGNKEQKITLSNFDPLASYKLYFDYQSNKISNIVVRVNSDIDYEANGSKNTSSELGINSQTVTWTRFVFPFKSYRGARDVSLSFLVSQTSNCQSDTNTPLYFKHCMPKKNTQKLIFQYKNLFVERLFTNQMILMRKNDSYQLMSAPKSITFQEINAATYLVHVKNSSSPYMLTFLENFDNGWKAAFTDTNKQINQQNHFLVDSYANGWYVDRKGNYDILIRYSAENLYDEGKIITFVSIALGLLLVVYIKHKYA